MYQFRVPSMIRPLTENQKFELKLKDEVFLEFKNKDEFIRTTNRLVEDSVPPSSISVIHNGIYDFYGRKGKQLTHYQHLRFTNMMGPLTRFWATVLRNGPTERKRLALQSWQEEVCSWLFGHAAPGEELNALIIDSMLAFNDKQYKHFGDECHFN